MKSFAALVVVLAACQQNPSALGGAAGDQGAADKLDKLDHKLEMAGVADTSAAPSGSLEERVAKVEHKVDKIIKALDQAMGPAEPDPDTVYSMPIADIDPVQGPKDAKITIVEGFEFLCPYCALANPTADQILAKYPKDVRLVSKYLIIHGPPAVPPGMYACAANKQGKYPEMKAALWSHFFKIDGGRPSLQQDQISQESIEKIAEGIGLDMTKAKADALSPECQKWLEQSQEDLRAVGANATPAFFINGRPISGAQPMEAFDKVIAEEIAKADKKIADGVAVGDYYQKEVVEKGEKKVKGRFDD